MKKRMLSLLLGVLLLAASFPAGAYAADGIAINEVNFPDENFRSYVKEYCDMDRNMYLSPQELGETVAIYVCDKSITSLQGIEFFTELEYLNCEHNKLIDLDVKQNTMLKSLNCRNNQLTSLNLQNNNVLEKLYCDSNELTELDTNMSPKLTEIYCNQNQLTTLNVRANKEMLIMFCNDNQLSVLDLSENRKLEHLFCDNNKLSELDVSKQTGLIMLDCSDNRLSKLILNENAPLQTFTFGNNQLTELNGVPMSVSVLEGDFQYVPAQMQWSAEGWTVDFNKLVSAGNLDKIELNPDSGWIYNQNTGKAVFKGDTVPDGMAYYYFGYPDGMEVRLSLEHEIVCVVMKENAEQAVVNGLLSPTTQYASGYAKMVNINGTMQIPLRYIAEVNRCPVYYDESTGKTKITSWAGGRFIMITQGSKLVEKYYTTGNIFFAGEAPLPFINQNGVTMGPLRFTCEVLDLNVVYQETSHGNYVVISPVAKTTEEALAKIEEAYQLGL